MPIREQERKQTGIQAHLDRSSGHHQGHPVLYFILPPADGLTTTDSFRPETPVNTCPKELVRILCAFCALN